MSALYSRLLFPIPDGYVTSQMILEWIEGDQAGDQMPPTTSPFHLLLWHSLPKYTPLYSRWLCHKPNDSGMIEGDQAVDVAEGHNPPPPLYFKPPLTFMNLAAIYSRWLWHKPDDPGMDRRRPGSWSGSLDAKHPLFYILPPHPSSIYPIWHPLLQYMLLYSRWLWHKPDDSGMEQLKWMRTSRRHPQPFYIPPTSPLPPQSPSCIPYINPHLFIPDGYDTSQMILEWMDGDQAVEVDGNLQMASPSTSISRSLNFSTRFQYMSLYSRWLWHKPDDPGMDRRRRSSWNGWESPDATHHLPSTSFHPIPLPHTPYGIPYFSTCPSIPDGYDTSQMILEWIEGEEAVEMDENLQMPQFVFSKDPQPEGCIKRYKTGGFSTPCLLLPAPCSLFLAPQVPQFVLSRLPQPEGGIKRYKTGEISTPCSFPSFLLPAPLLSAPCSLLPTLYSQHSPPPAFHYGIYYGPSHT